MPGPSPSLGGIFTPPQRLRGIALNMIARNNPSAVFMSADPPDGGLGVYAQSMAVSLTLRCRYSLAQQPRPWAGIYRKMTPRAIPLGVRGVPYPHAEIPYWPKFSDLVLGSELMVTGSDMQSGIGIMRTSFVARGLEQDRTYYLRVLASADGRDSLGNPYGSTEYAWEFRTGRRDVTVTPGRLVVELDGDPGGSGEMDFKLALYDGVSGAKFAEARYPDSGEADLSDGAVVSSPFPAFTKSKVGSSIVVYMDGNDDDGSFEQSLPWVGLDISGTGTYENYPGKAVAWESNSGLETAGRNAAGLFKEVLLSDSPGRHEQSFDLFSGAHTIRFRQWLTVAHELVPARRRPKLILTRYPYPDGWWSDTPPPGVEPLVP